MRKKTFANFADLCSATKVFSMKFWGVANNTQQEFLAHVYSTSYLSFDQSTCPDSSTFRQAHCYQGLMVPFRQLFLLEYRSCQRTSPRGRHPDNASKRGTHESFTHKEKAQIRKWATEYGVTASVHHFSNQLVTE